MKKIVLFLFMFSFTVGYAQTTWQPMYLTVSGGHVVDGVEGWFASGECNGAPVVFLKFVNTNASPVQIKYFDGIFTQSLEWVKKTDIQDLRTMSLPAQTELAGQCGNATILIVLLADYNLTASDFKRYTSQEFIVTFQ
jgi:hypothetical protein